MELKYKLKKRFKYANINSYIYKKKKQILSTMND